MDGVFVLFCLTVCQFLFSYTTFFNMDSWTQAVATATCLMIKPNEMTTLVTRWNNTNQLTLTPWFNVGLLISPTTQKTSLRFTLPPSASSRVSLCHDVCSGWWVWFCCPLAGLVLAPLPTRFSYTGSGNIPIQRSNAPKLSAIGVNNQHTPTVLWVQARINQLAAWLCELSS